MTTTTNDQTTFRRNLARERDYVASLPVWHGRIGGRNLRILMTVYNYGIRAGTRYVTLSCRQIASKVAVNKDTVAKGLTDLVRDGWLRFIGHVLHEGKKIRQYHLSEQGTKQGSFSDITLTRGVDVAKTKSNVRITSLLWDSEGLGVSAGRVHGFLVADAPTTVKELATSTGYSIKTVGNALRTLERYKLAGREGRRWYRTKLDPNELGKALGLGKRRRELEIRHALDQDAYDYYLEQKKAKAISGINPRPELPPDAKAVTTRQAIDKARPVQRWALPKPEPSKQLHCIMCGVVQPHSTVSQCWQCGYPFEKQDTSV